jgi:hypothetical protein
MSKKPLQRHGFSAPVSVTSGSISERRIPYHKVGGPIRFVPSEILEANPALIELAERAERFRRVS